MMTAGRFGAIGFFALLVACSGGTKDGEGFASNGPPGSGGVDAGADGTIPPAPSGPDFSDDAGEAAPPCVNLECKRQTCPGGATTTITGTVWDPAGKNPLYNAIVYVPNAKLDPITHGASCDKCAGSATGSPIATALSDTTGAFTLKDVPIGDNIPLVIQIGKWRRQVTIPTVAACTENKITDPNMTRLPANQKEGDMPLIALTGGCDPVHMLIQKVGIAATELTNETGTGTVHVFAGQGGQNGGVAGATDAYAFWGTLTKMMKYDLIINECECDHYPRDTVGPAYANMAAYLNAGGRSFNSHYHLNFFGGENGHSDPTLLTVADFALWGGASTGTPNNIDTSFPKGKALADWMQNLQKASKWGPGIKTSPYGQLIAGMAGDIKAAKPGISQQWITGGSAVGYMSINFPLASKPEDRCGRAVLTDLHVGSGGGSMIEQEAALEYMLFDLSSCVQDDNVPPAPPPPVR
jgi:hypothetical protein